MHAIHTHICMYIYTCVLMRVCVCVCVCVCVFVFVCVCVCNTNTYILARCRSTPPSIPDNIDFTPDTFAAALSEVQLALEIMDTHSYGVDSPDSWHGRCVSSFL